MLSLVGVTIPVAITVDMLAIAIRFTLLDSCHPAMFWNSQMVDLGFNDL